MRYSILKLFFVLMFFSTHSSAQTSSDSISIKIAIRLRDSLSLSSSQYDSVLSINRRLHLQKMEARKSFPSFDSLTRKIQGIELQRDSLYKTVLTDKFDLYLQKKRNLIHNNQ